VVGNYEFISMYHWQLETLDTYSKEHLEGIIDHELGTGERSNHDYPHTKTIEQSFYANFAVDPANSLNCGFTGFAIAVEFRHHYI
jgi:hypothetical protein